LVRTVKRIVVVGTTGVGKTTFARELAQRLGQPHLELDSVFHQPGWTPLATEEFRARTCAQLDDAEGWVVDGNYNEAVGTHLQRRADSIVWLDLPRQIVMRRVILRTLWRLFTREELWNGNREPLSNLWNWAPEQNIIRWAWVSYPENRKRYERRCHDGSWGHARVIRLCTNAAIEAFDCSSKEAEGG